MKIKALDSVRLRLTLWYVAALAFVLVTVCVIIYTLLSRSLHSRVDDGLLSVIEVATRSLTHDTEESQTSEGAAQSTVIELSNAQQTLAIYDGAGRLLAENTLADEFHAALPDLEMIAGGKIHIGTVADLEGEHHRIAAQRVVIPQASSPFIILVSQPLEFVEDELESLREILYWVVPVGLLMAGLGGWFLARKSLAPVARMSEQARQIGAGNLDRRLPVANPRDELGRLAVTFNELLARLSAAFAQQRQFMADASHELRTPLSVMRTAADVTLERARRDEDEYRDAIKMIDEQTRRLTRIVEDMFTLARADAGRYPIRKSKFYLDELIQEAARAAGVLASGKDVKIEISNLPESLYHGDEDLLRQMILNLLDNAVKHTPRSGAVRLTVARSNQSYRIEVADTGGGIPAQAQAHVFERFYRAGKTRSSGERGNGSGAGLGLSIARWIAEAHAGSLVLARSDKNGSVFAVTLPITEEY
jgi:heavy metal sensor kinase